MYRACIEINFDLHKRTKCIKQFFERIIANGNTDPLKTFVFSNKNDIENVIKETFARLEELFEQRQKN